MSGILTCIFSPRLYRIYARANQNAEVHNINWAEQWGDFAIGYLFPAGLMFSVWQRKIHYFFYLTVLVASSYLLRAAGRAFNPTYVTFLQVLKRAQQTFNTENAELLRRYDFDFTSWPIAFKSLKFSQLALEIQNQTGGISRFSPSYIMGYLVAHTFGIRLIYPGLLFGSVIRSHLEEARAKYVTEQRGLRTRIQCADGNTLDTMFFDRRSDVNQNGRTLVICFEGNAGFYEIGMMVTPLNDGYSTLGWNHPGFGGSTGTPYPPAELNAAEAVLDYAIQTLGFREDEIILYAWSIGGYPAAYLAGNHPNIKGVILDATFDDILPLALPRMPAFMSSLVEVTIRNHVNLQVNRQLRGYHGPLRLIRRTDDEIIAEPPGSLTANRGSYLLVDVIRHRYPSLLNNLESEKALLDWLARSHATDPSSTVSPRNLPEPDIPDDVESISNSEKARLVVLVAQKIMTDYKSSHCTPLPSSMFQLPWVGVEKFPQKKIV